MIILGCLSYYCTSTSFVCPTCRSVSIRLVTSLFEQGVKSVFTPTIKVIVREYLPELSTSSLVLVFPCGDAVDDSLRPFRLYCDTKMNSFGATLKQTKMHSSTHPPRFQQARYPRLRALVGPLRTRSWQHRIRYLPDRWLRSCLWSTRLRIYSNHGLWGPGPKR